MVGIQQIADHLFRRSSPEAIASCWQALLASLSSAGAAHERPRLVGITSCVRGEGVTTVAANLAKAAAGQTGGQSVLLVDANWRSPSLHRLLKTNPSPGFAELLCGDCELETAIRPLRPHGFAVVPAGDPQRMAADVASHLGRFERLATVLKEQFGFVVFDLPPAAPGSLATWLGRFLDGVVLVVEAERERWPVVRRSQQVLAQSQAPVLGVALNKRRNYIPGWLYRRI